MANPPFCQINGDSGTPIIFNNKSIFLSCTWFCMPFELLKPLGPCHSHCQIEMMLFKQFKYILTRITIGCLHHHLTPPGPTPPNLHPPSNLHLYIFFVIFVLNIYIYIYIYIYTQTCNSPFQSLRTTVFNVEWRPISTAKKGQEGVKICVKVAGLPSTAQFGGAIVSLVVVQAGLFTAVFSGRTAWTAAQIKLYLVKMLHVIYVP